MSRKGVVVTMVVVAGIAAAGAAAVWGVRGYLANKEATQRAAARQTEYVDADDYYNSAADVLDVIDVKESDRVQTETEVVEDLQGRGFVDYPITTEYSMDGDLTEEQEVTGSKESHPSYQTYYISTSGEYWSIIVMNGCIMANPISYNIQSGQSVQVVLSESESIMCYDGPTNQFYETIPYESSLIVKVVEHIDAQMLDQMTVEVIAGL